MTDYPTCPYCGDVIKDWQDIGPFAISIEADTEILCDECGKTYNCSKQVTIYFRNRPKA